MNHHAAFGRTIETLDVVIVEDNRHMQAILRSILNGLGVGKLRVYDRADIALKEMLPDPPHVVIADWHMEPMTGLALLEAMRHRSMMPLSLVPFVMMTGHPTRAAVERAFRAGAHQFLAKPLSPAILRSRLAHLMCDPRRFRLEQQLYVIEGVEDMLELARMKREMQAMLASRIKDGRVSVEQPPTVASAE